MNHTDKGKFKKGERPVGRKKGVPNKVTSETREFFNKLIESNFNQELLDELPAEKRADLLLRLLPYVLPKYADIGGTDDDDDKTITITIDSPLTNRAGTD